VWSDSGDRESRESGSLEHRVDRRTLLRVTLALMLGLDIVLACLGCGASVPDGSALAVNGRSSSTAPAGLDGGDARSAGTVFSNLAGSGGSMPIYGWIDAPEGATLLADWLPVIDQEDPDNYEGPAVPNPRISGGGGYDPEIQVVFSYGGGWLVVVENFRGDLGDVTGTVVGSISGHAASLYEVNGGCLVQWSDGGRWYGVFGRKVQSEQLVPLALDMATMPAGGSP
jgi:hypothetical protein